jgi:hypothetical protein
MDRPIEIRLKPDPEARLIDIARCRAALRAFLDPILVLFR